jgi:hypothetical protein
VVSFGLAVHTCCEWCCRMHGNLPSPTKVDVGIFYYVWYGAVESDWRAPEFVDCLVSVLGNYGSANGTVIGQQLVWIGGLGVDFVVVSWWGCNEDDYLGCWQIPGI